MKNLKILLAALSLMFVFSGFNLAQSVTLATLGGESVSLDAQRGKVVVLAVGATWLPLSKNQAAITNRLAKKYTGRDVVIYFVATDSAAAKSKNYASGEDIQAFVTRAKLSSVVLRDADGAATLKKFKVDQLPAFLIFGKDGKLASEPFGGLTPTAAAEAEMADLISKRIDEIL